jgi:hypothetical protein
MGLGGGAQTNASNDQGYLNAIIGQLFSQIAPGLTGVAAQGGTNANINSAAGTLQGIASGANQQGQIQSLSNTFNNANTSGLNTLMSQLGGVANPNLLAKGIATQNAQSGLQNTQNLQAGLTGQQLTAAQGLGSLGNSQIGNIISALGTYGSNLSGLFGGINSNEAQQQNQANQNQQQNENLITGLVGGLFG